MSVIVLQTGKSNRHNEGGGVEVTPQVGLTIFGIFAGSVLLCVGVCFLLSWLKVPGFAEPAGNLAPSEKTKLTAQSSSEPLSFRQRLSTWFVPTDHPWAQPATSGVPTVPPVVTATPINV